MKIRLHRAILALVILWFSAPSYAWDATGHRLVAAIAYAQLTPQVKQLVDDLTAQADPDYPPQARFLYASTQPDKWRTKDDGLSSGWHFIDSPWSVDGTPTIPAAEPNLLTIMADNEHILTDPATAKAQKARALAYVIHLAGDAHQPLHCINRFNQQFPQGDRGGNLFLIQDTYATNLHAFWDRGTALLLTPTQHYPLTNKKVLRLARQLQQRYSATFWGDKATDLNVADWTAQCYTIAQQTVYQLPFNAKPSAPYRATTAITVSQQLTLAGYRLGNLLNSLLQKKDKSP